ncbi:MAG TPA: hydrogenase maturation nickel metallochaperone HypA [Actinomycetales bacterium]|jgi:hydrogenase nickel incorporation protein HypA/HybF|nr:hydrogenase maturation nickel metallochaperone HypA [Actinomycetales bacterium]
MHELSITQGIVDTISERMGDARITGVRLEIGRLSGVLPEQVRFCFDLVCAGTALDGAWLEIIEPRGTALCHRCGAEFEPPSLLALCQCGSADVQIRSGQELRITALEVA